MMDSRRTDAAVLFFGVAMLLTFLVNAKVGSVWLVYVLVVATAGVWGYVVWREDTQRLLRRSIIVGAAASLVYLPADSLFSHQAHLLFYLSQNALHLGAPPLSLVLTWILSIGAVIYLYLRLESAWQRKLPAVLLTGLVVFVGSVVIDQLGSQRLWTWNATRFKHIPYIGTVPVSVPVALALTFLFTPYFFRKQPAIIAGVRCGLFLAAFQLLCFVGFRYIGVTAGSAP